MQAKSSSDGRRASPKAKVNKNSRAPVETVTIEGDLNESS